MRMGALKLSKDDCSWCRFKPVGANPCAKDCDFMTLAFDKDSIVERVKSEIVIINNLKKDVEKDIKVMDEVMDRAFGLSVMTRALKEDFDMSSKDLRKVLGAEMNVYERTKLMAKMAMLKKNRGSL